MRVGILGSGVVAQSLGRGFLLKGHEVVLGTRDPQKLGQWAKENPQGKVGSFEEAAGFAELGVLAVKGTAALDAVRAAGPSNLAGKPVIDATNPIDESAPVNGVLAYFTDHDDSLMEQLQREFDAVHFVKAFSSVGAHLMVDPQFEGGKPTMFICGDDAGAKQTVSDVCDSFGWEVADMGAVEAARAIEPLAMLWCIPGFRENQWVHAFKLLR